MPPLGRQNTTELALMSGPNGWRSRSSRLHRTPGINDEVNAYPAVFVAYPPSAGSSLDWPSLRGAMQPHGCALFFWCRKRHIDFFEAESPRRRCTGENVHRILLRIERESDGFCFLPQDSSRCRPTDRQVQCAGGVGGLEGKRNLPQMRS